MGDDDHGGLSVGEVPQDTEDFAGQLRVKGAGGLIEAEDVRVERQGAGDGHPLLLTAGEFGILCGVLAGFLHASVALNVGIVYGGMNLYNNGFAGGIVAMFLVPVIQSIRDRRARAKGDLSL